MRHHPADLMSIIPAETGKVTGRVTSWDVIDGVDKALHDPAIRSKMRAWFINEWWPAVLQRVASGAGITDRELSIASYVVEDARSRA